MEGCGDGGPKDVAFKAMWADWYPRLAAYLRSFGALSAEDREELAADAVFRAWERRHSFDSDRPLGPWLYAIARRVAIDRLRMKTRRKEQPLDLDATPLADDRGRGPEREALDDEERRWLGEFLGAASESDRELAFLVYGAGLTLSEAARVRGEPLGTAKWRLHALRSRLRAGWEEAYGRS
jgi:RNA polymerase sigma-70 factor (ECF subfamily)